MEPAAPAEPPRAGLRPKLRLLAFRVLRASLLPALVREVIQRRRVTLVLYHDPDIQILERHLAVLQRLYTIIPLRDLVDALVGGHFDQLPSKSLVITLDDGHRANYALKPLLERRGIPVTIFLCSGIVGSHRRFWFKHVADPDELKLLRDDERLARLRALGFDEDEEVPEREALSRREIAEMSGRFVDFQSHSVSHPILPMCVEDKARDEIYRSRSELAHDHQLDVYAFAYPSGDYSDRDIKLAAAAGYTCAVTVDLGFNSSRTNPFQLKRIGIDDKDGIDELIVKVSGVWGLVRWVSRSQRISGHVRAHGAEVRRTRSS